MRCRVYWFCGEAGRFIGNSGGNIGAVGGLARPRAVPIA